MSRLSVPLAAQVAVLTSGMRSVRVGRRALPSIRVAGVCSAMHKGWYFNQLWAAVRVHTISACCLVASSAAFTGTLRSTRRRPLAAQQDPAVYIGHVARTGLDTVVPIALLKFPISWLLAGGGWAENQQKREERRGDAWHCTWLLWGRALQGLLAVKVKIRVKSRLRDCI